MSALSNPTPTPVQPQRVAPVATPQPPKKGFPWKLLVILGVIAFGAVVGYNYWVQPQQQKAAQTAAVTAFRTTKVIVGPFQRTMRLGGVTSALKYANITAPRIRGPEARQMELLKLVKSGLWVNQSDVLAEMDPGYLTDHVDDIKANIQQAENDVSKREAEQAVELETLVQTLRVSQATVGKAKLDNQAAEVRTDVERELLKLAYDEAEAKYKQSQLDVPQKKIIHGAEIKILGFTRERHVRHIGRHLGDIKLYTVVAPMKGMVVLSSVFRGGGESQQLQQGDQVMPGQPMMKIVDPASMQVEATVNQAESTEVRIGQQATIGFDAFPGLTLKGKVYSIGALAVGGFRQNYFIRNIPVRMTIEGADPRLIPDLSAFADVVLEEKDSAALIPLDALHEEGGKTYVYVKQGDGWAKREVSIASANNLYAVAASGVIGGEELRLK